MTALARGLQVLQAFKSGEERLGNQEIAERCSMPKSTVSRLTYTLTKLGFLHHDDDASRYRLGMATLSLGGTTLSRLDAKEVSRPVMQKLADSTQCLIALGIREGMSMLYVETCRSDSVVTLRLNLGSRMPLATSSMGRAYLAAVKPGARKSLEDRMRALDPASWPSIEDGIHKAMEELAEFGCCSSFGDWRPEVHGIATPLRVGKGMPLMILSAAGPAQSMPAELFMHAIRPALLAAAQEIEAHFRPRSS
ncbi:IclR family transcriptional regulator [Variovorax saccharolyticus]|uniref:IclR family transcriptional regulator n=1 Tax=Variovorax saccharolyticus TaxID=3053516 RepID=UPI00257668C1|nr:IclR family transcriptional regulator [Variovorax sp. J22R187]MDM0021236.1 IclR family transcriptional regulator [Variovorax sp. J22R187]